MKPVSFTAGVVGLVGTFTACVNCFECFRVGRDLGEDYETCVVNLDLVLLRFTPSVGISGVDEDVAVAQLCSKLVVPEKDFDTVKRTLSHMLRQFERTVEVSNRLRSKSGGCRGLDNEGFCLNDDNLGSLHEKIKLLASSTTRGFYIDAKDEVDTLQKA